MTKRDLPDFIADALGEEAADRQVANTVGALGAILKVAPPAPALRQKLLQAIQAGALRYAPFWDRLGSLFDLSESGVSAVLDDAENASKWEASPIPGMSLFHLQGGPRVATADVGLVRLPPNVAFPHHKHLGDERVLVLQGAYEDSGGRIYRAGDLHEMRVGSDHGLTALDQGVLFAVVLFEGISIEGVGVLTARGLDQDGK